jgi:hypothetical protein
MRSLHTALHVADEKRILLLGHLDTVLSGEPYRRDGKKRTGQAPAT